MRILVVGASGFLGAHTYRLLTRQDDAAVVGTYGRRAVFPGLRHVDLSSRSSVMALMRAAQPEVVIWCAKHTAPALEAPILETGLPSLTEAARPGTKLVFVSTDGVLPGTSGRYGEGADTLPVDSGSAVAQYTNAKRNAEQFIASAWDDYSIVRVGPIYGRSSTGEWDARVLGLLEAFRLGETVSRAANIKRTFIQVEDLAAALCELSTSAYKGILHLGPAEPASYFDFARTVAEVSGFPVQRVRPYDVSSEEIRERAIRADTSMDTEWAGRILKTRFRPLQEGMADAARPERFDG